MKYFDAHTHLQFAAYDEDREEVFARSREAGVGMNVVGTDRSTSRAAIECAKIHEEVWASVGLHPTHSSEEVFDAAVYEAMAREEKVIAIGECGLDYFRLDEETKEKQFETFVAHIEVANKVNKPLMLHIRSGKHGEVANSAYDDAVKLLQTHAKVLGDVHFFAGKWETAKKFLDLGFTLSFTGVVTFAQDYHDVVRNTPLDMLLTETDAPFVTPTPHRGRRNEPQYIPLILQKIAQIKGLDEEVVRAQILLNSTRVFGIA